MFFFAALFFFVLVPVESDPLGGIFALGPPHVGAQNLRREDAATGKLALLIAVSDYPMAETGVPPLNSHNDVPLIRGALMTQGFDSAQIRVVADEEATLDGIVSAVRNHLINKAGSGSIVFLHFSGHGHRITDDDGDELDGYDEALVPFDAPGTSESGYRGHLHLRDEELGDLLLELREIVGPSGNVVVSIDACFSGSATRATKGVATRGMPDPIGPPLGAAPGSSREAGGGFFETASSTRGVPDREGLAPYVVFSASRHDEHSWETLGPHGEPVGSLSLALSQAIAESRPGTTYRDLFDRVKKRMLVSSPLQTPQLEGNHDTEVFSGRIVEQEPFHEIETIRNDSTVILRGGQVLGLLPGTHFSFHPPGTQEGSSPNPLASGVATRVNPLRTEVLLEEPVDPDLLDEAWAFVTARAFGDFKAKLQFIGLDQEQRSAVERGFLASGTVRIVEENPDLVLRPSTAGGGLFLVSAWDHAPILGPLEGPPEGWISRVVTRAHSFAVSRLLLGTEMDSPDMRVNLKVLPSRHHFNPDGTCDGLNSEVLEPESALTVGGQWEFSPDEGFLLELENEGRTPAHVTVLDIRPNGEVSQIFPHPALTGEDNLLDPGRSYRIGLCYTVGEPFGKEILKLFATRERVDFQPILEVQERTRGLEARSPLEHLFMEALAGTRSAPSRRAGSAGHTDTAVIQVVPGPIAGRR